MALLTPHALIFKIDNQEKENVKEKSTYRSSESSGFLSTHSSPCR
ncbi:hypothetical protein VCR8J2_240106 [Vibrio coralliirubri]|nr:hypothetical protein VCR8J2_240106 [Vibrio coralliirubri]